MTLLQLQYFKTLARVLHYTQAAAELHIAQPSLSYSIKELEKLSSSSDKTSKSLTKLSNRVVEALSPDSGVNAMDRFAAQKQYLNAIDRTIKSYELSGNAAEAYRKQVSLLSREYQKMAAIAPKNAITGLLGSRLGSAETNLDTTLQREANRYFGYTAQQVLDTVQKLYEQKLCTYPRTDSQYLTEDMEH